MAIATSTAIAAAGLAVSAGSATMSFVQAGKQRKLQRQAERDAKEAMEEARKKLEVNYYDQLAIQKEPYELEREALLSAGAQGIQAGQEAETRGAAATAGRVQMAQQAGQRQIASAMGQELMGLEKLSAQEESRLRDIGVELDLGEVQGAQLAARDAQEAAVAATQQGMQSVGQFAQQAIQMAPLFDKTPSSRIASQIDRMGMKDLNLSQVDMQKNIAALGKVNGVDLSKVASMTPMQYQDFMGKLDVNTLNAVKGMLPNRFQSFAPGYTPQKPFQLPPSFQYNFNIPGVGGQ